VLINLRIKTIINDHVLDNEPGCLIQTGSRAQHPPIEWVPGTLSWGQSGRGVKAYYSPPYIA
jgi:hypothetical protein